ncbi:P-loop containing nucleoside triphosphate hydrolase protein [Obelidium mucronatum]|nr:P-loop containing nucleoside triphosphate hydrolase protein [Obelidium mucronatum]
MIQEQMTISQPTTESRANILKTLLSQSSGNPTTECSPDLTADQVAAFARDCSGFTLADLAAVWNYANCSATIRTDAEMTTRTAETTAISTATSQPRIISSNDIQDGITKVKSHIRKTGTHGVEIQERGRIEFGDIGGLEGVKELLMESLFWFHGKADALERFGIQPSKGVLLYGPPGTGKTLLAKAIATETKANFISISVSAIIKGHIGESEKQITSLFAQAKATSPCIIFLDEIESIFTSRENSGDFSQKILAQLVQEMDALSYSGKQDASGGGGGAAAAGESNSTTRVVVLAATNYPQLMDTTLLRPGRIDRLIAVRSPNLAQRISIFQVLAKKMEVDGGGGRCSSLIDWSHWAARVKGFSGAGIAELFRKAKLVGLTRKRGQEYAGITMDEQPFQNVILENQDFEDALDDITTSREVTNIK